MAPTLDKVGHAVWCLMAPEREPQNFGFWPKAEAEGTKKKDFKGFYYISAKS